jgi:hypothetical protein
MYDKYRYKIILDLHELKIESIISNAGHCTLYNGTDLARLLPFPWKKILTIQRGTFIYLSMRLEWKQAHYYWGTNWHIVAAWEDR